MKANVGGFDRALRIMVGLVLVILTIGDVIGPWGYLGLIVLATGLFSFCGAYTTVVHHPARPDGRRQGAAEKRARPIARSAVS